MRTACVDLGPRYEPRERLGEGGFGEVFRVFDREWREEVALKRLTRFHEPAALERFLNEYRSLVDVEHPNLVALYQLAAYDRRPYFTMELVRDGSNFDAYVRGDALPARAAEDVPLGDTTESIEKQRLRPTRDYSRLERTLRQLVAGICALHAGGTVHRDIKPANVLVTPAGRVVVLDFGLAAEQSADISRTGGHGTLRYMAYEQVESGRPNPASDWYSVGVMLYEVLSGERLCEGSLQQVLLAKLRPPPDAASIAPDAPGYLTELCSALLQPRPEDRPSDAAIARAVGLDRDDGAAAIGRVPKLAPIGRAAQLFQLDEAFERSKSGGVVVAVDGEGGAGKTTLVSSFVDTLREREPRLVVVPSRCHPQDNTPFKAVDALVVALSRRLREMESRDGTASLDNIIPEDVYPLTHLFPVLLGVKAIEFAARRGEARPVKDPQERRQRAFAALREMVWRAAQYRSVVLFVDDLQWGDVDSARLLVELLRAPEAPPILLVVCFRSEDRTRSRCLDALLGSVDGSMPQPPVEVVRVTCGPLGHREAHQLLRRRMRCEVDSDVLDAITRESGGNPFWLVELARLHDDEGYERRGGDVLAGAIRRRLEGLPSSARAVVELVCVALRPTYDVVANAAKLAQADVRRFVKRLAGMGIVYVAADERLDLYHQRLREYVLGILAEQPERLVERHRTIVEVLEQAQSNGEDVDDGELAHHYAEAGLHEAAGRLLLRAADDAARALAFDQAAELYAQRLRMAPLSADECRHCLEQRAHALANGGHGVAAAEIFAELAEQAEPREARELLRLAAEQWMRAGHVERGLAALDGQLRAADLRLPPTPWRALLSLLVNRVRLWGRGLSYSRRQPEHVDPERAWRADLLWSVSNGLAMADVLRASDYQTRGVIAALETGDPYRIGRALAFEAGFMGTRGINGERRFARLIAQAQSIAEERGDEHLRGLTVLARGINAYLSARFAVAARLNGEAEQLLRGCEDASWEVSTSQLFALQALVHIGRLDELAERLPPLVREACARGNVYLASSLRVAPTQVLYLARDDIDEARAQVEAAMEDWRPNSGFYLMNYWAMAARAQTELYAGDPVAALEAVLASWSQLEYSQWLRLPLVRALSLHTRARCVVAVAKVSRGARRSELLEEGVKLAAQIARTRGTYGAWARAMAKSVEAGLCRVDGDDELASRLLVEAAAQFDVSEIGLYALACRLQRGALIGGSEGDELKQAAATRMQQMGVSNVERMAAVLVPGFAE
ncbi:MAG: protein kinase [Myxococcales bacterium]|nr:protein kinase [Myxococcales bacterium]